MILTSQHREYARHLAAQVKHRAKEHMAFAFEVLENTPRGADERRLLVGLKRIAVRHAPQLDYTFNEAYGYAFEVWAGFNHIGSHALHALREVSKHGGALRAASQRVDLYEQQLKLLTLRWHQEPQWV